MNITVDVFDYLTPEDIKEVALDEIRKAIRYQYSGPEANLNRLLVNLSYQYVWEMVNQQFDGKLEEQLKAQISKVIKDLSTYTIFRRKDSFEKQDSIAYIILQEEMASARPLIKARVDEIIQNYNFREVKDGLGDVVYQCVMDRLFGSQKGEQA